MNNRIPNYIQFISNILVDKLIERWISIGAFCQVTGFIVVLEAGQAFPSIYSHE